MRRPEGDQWLHEIKFDGYRIHARLDRGAVKLLTRTGLDWTHKYPAIARAVWCGATCRIRSDNWNPDAHPPIIGRMGQTLPYEFGNVQCAV
jgi:hypothetical protein